MILRWVLRWVLRWILTEVGTEVGTEGVVYGRLDMEKKSEFAKSCLALGYNVMIAVGGSSPSPLHNRNLHFTLDILILCTIVRSILLLECGMIL